MKDFMNNHDQFGHRRDDRPRRGGRGGFEQHGGFGPRGGFDEHGPREPFEGPAPRDAFEGPFGGGPRGGRRGRGFDGRDERGPRGDEHGFGRGGRDHDDRGFDERREHGHHHGGPRGGRGFDGPRGFDAMGFGPFGGPGGGRGPRRGPGRGRKGDVRNAVLALLAEQQLNGYGLINAIAEKSDGLWRPSAGSIYPALGLLEDEGLIEPTEGEGKKVYRLTEAGRKHVEEHAEELDEPWNKVSEPHKGFLDVRGDLQQLGMAVQQVVVTGDQEQVEAARKILERARKDVYRLLAGDAEA